MTLSRKRARGAVLWVTSLVVLSSLPAACSGDEIASGVDANKNDANTNDAHTTIDASAQDASSEARGEDAAPADAGCPCVVGDAAFDEGTTSISCYCARPAGCPSYDRARTCGGVGQSYLIMETYTDCNVVNVRLDTGFVSSWRIFDATTHEIVGALDGNDGGTIACGARQVFVLRAGYNPIDEGCHVATRVPVCPEGGVPDAEGGPSADHTEDDGVSSDARDVDVDGVDATGDRPAVPDASSADANLADALADSRAMDALADANDPACPISYSAAAGDCSTSGLRCQYPEGACECMIGCGPPPPPDASSYWLCAMRGAGCPIQKPAPDTPCSVDAQLCNYGTCCTDPVRCEGGQWKPGTILCPP